MRRPLQLRHIRAEAAPEIEVEPGCREVSLSDNGKIPVKPGAAHVGAAQTGPGIHTVRVEPRWAGLGGLLI